VNPSSCRPLLSIVSVSVSSGVPVNHYCSDNDLRWLTITMHTLNTSTHAITLFNKLLKMGLSSLSTVPQMIWLPTSWLKCCHVGKSLLMHLNLGCVMPVGECRNLALWGRPKWKQVEWGAVQEATLHAARSWANLSHQVVPPAPQHTQGHAPETGALCTHSQWIGLFYIHSLTVLYLILVAILT